MCNYQYPDTQAGHCATTRGRHAGTRAASVTVNACFKKSLFPAHGVHEQCRILAVRREFVSCICDKCLCLLLGVCHSIATRPFTHALVHNCTQLPSHTLWGSPQEAAPPTASPVPRGMYRGKGGRCVVCVSLVPAPPPPPPRDTARRKQTRQSGELLALYVRSVEITWLFSKSVSLRERMCLRVMQRKRHALNFIREMVIIV